MADTKEQAITNCVEAQLTADHKSPIKDTIKMGPGYGYANENQIKQFLIGVDNRLKTATPTHYTFVYPEGQTPSFAQSCLSKTLFEVKIALAPHTKVLSPGVS
jgi:hypothetical protein